MDTMLMVTLAYSFLLSLLAGALEVCMPGSCALGAIAQESGAEKLQLRFTALGQA